MTSKELSAATKRSPQPTTVRDGKVFDTIPLQVDDDEDEIITQDELEDEAMTEATDAETLAPETSSSKLESRKKTPERTEKKSGLTGASFNFINSIVGAGIIGIPFAIQRCGFFGGVFLIFFVAYLVDYGVCQLVRCGIKTKKHSYEALCQHVFGLRGFYAVSWFMFIFAYGAMVAYLIIIGDTIPKIAKQAQLHDFLEDRTAVIIIFAVVFMLPLSLLKDMSSLAWSSLVSILADLILVIIVVSGAPDAAANEGISAPNEPNAYSVIRHTFFAGLGSISFAFTCHHSSFFVHGSLKTPTMRRWSIVTHASLIVALISCLTLGLSGYLNFFSKVQSDVLNNFPDDDAIINFARALLAATMVFTFPMEQFVARHSLNAILFRKKQTMSHTRHIVMTLSLWSSSLLLGLCFEDLGIVLELTGAIAASMLGYVLPGMIVFTVDRHLFIEVKALWRVSSTSYEPNVRKRLMKSRHFILPAIMICFGWLACIVGTLSAFVE